MIKLHGLTHEVNTGMFVSKSPLGDWKISDESGTSRDLHTVDAGHLRKMLNECPVVSRDFFKKAIAESELERSRSITRMSKEAVKSLEFDVNELQTRLNIRTRRLSSSIALNEIIDCVFHKAFDVELDTDLKVKWCNLISSTEISYNAESNLYELRFKDSDGTFDKFGVTHYESIEYVARRLMERYC